MREAARGGALRGRGALPQPAVRGPAPRRAAGGRAAVGRHDRRDRVRGRGRPRGRADLPAARRQDGRPLLVPPRERRRPGPDDGARGVLPRVLRLGAERAAADRRAARRGRPLGARGVPLGAARRARRGARAPSAARSGGCRSSPTRTRSTRSSSEQAATEQKRRAARRGARGAARGAQPRVAADPDRVLRHLARHGPGHRRLDGRLPGRAAEEGALPQVRRSRRPATARTTSRRWPR